LRKALLGLGTNRGFVDRHWFQWLVIRVGRYNADIHDHIQAGLVCCFAKAGVLIVQEVTIGGTQKELRTSRIRVAGAGHRQHTRNMALLVEFSLDRVARTTSAGSLRTTTLDHEILDHAMKCHAVIVTNLGQTDQILAMTRSHFGPQIERDIAHVGFEQNLIGKLVEVDILLGGSNFGLTIRGHEYDFREKVVVGCVVLIHVFRRWLRRLDVFAMRYQAELGNERLSLLSSSVFHLVEHATRAAHDVVASIDV
jgi:hypothetical protein